MARKPLKSTEQVDYLLGKLQPGLRTKKKSALSEFSFSFWKRGDRCSKEDALRLFVGDKKYPVGLLAIAGKTKSSGVFQRAAHPAIDLIYALQDPGKNGLDWFVFRQVLLKLDPEQLNLMALQSHEQRPCVVMLRQQLITAPDLVEEAERCEREAAPLTPDDVLSVDTTRRSAFSFASLRTPRISKDHDERFSLDELKTPTKFRSSTLTSPLSADGLMSPANLAEVGRASSRSTLLKVAETKPTSLLPALLDGIAKEDVQASVQALAGLEGPVETVFDQQRVKAYRASKEDFSKEFQEGIANWNAPEFVSDRAVPESVVLQCHICIDADLAFTMRVTEQSLVSSVLEKAIAKAKMKAIEHPRPILKVRGCCSYLDATKLCISYQSAREAARAGRNLELILVNAPDPLPPTPASPWRQAWGGTLITEPMSTSKLLSQQNVPFKVKDLIGLGFREANTLAFAEVMITFGSTILTTSTSALLPCQKRLRFNLVNPDPPISYSQLPREARLGIAIFQSDQQGKRSLLGWSVAQMFDDKGLLRQGTIVLNLREPPEPASELCQLFARASTVEAKSEAGTASIQLEEFGNPIYHDDAVLAGGGGLSLPASRPRGDSTSMRPPPITPRRSTTDEVKFSIASTPTAAGAAVCQCPPSDDKGKFCLKCGKKRVIAEKQEVALKANEILCSCGKVVDRNKVYCFGCGTQVARLLAAQAKRFGSATPTAAPTATVVTVAVVEPDPPPAVAYTPSRKQTEADNLWATRQSLMDKPHMLVPVLLSCNWSNLGQRAEARRLLTVWARPQLVDALQLLDVAFPDAAVRELAVQVLSSLPPYRLELYLLQLTQCLKFEQYHRSALATFLVKSALRHPLIIGQPLYYHIRTEMQMQPGFAERYKLILVDFLSYGGPLLRELRVQVEALGQLQRVAEMVVTRKESGKSSKDEIMQEYTQELVKLNCYFFSRQNKIKLPLNPQVEVTSLIVEKCRFMSSKKVPLWLVFVNADPSEPEPVYVIFKSGDDLRQDMLTLQLLSLMDDFWMQDGHDLRLTPYRVLATGVNSKGEGMGMIEVVTSSDTTSGIQGSYGGGAMGAFKLTPLFDYLTALNAGEAFKAAVNIFMRSSAGYCVATYVMGIGDRHNGNIMVKSDGHLFHIDFGHFLGNFKSKFGVRRERAPFVFTPEMAFVIGGKNFEQAPQYKVFEELCVKAFNALRSREALLYTLFNLMVSAGMPELLSVDDITYMKEQLCLGATDQAAAEVFLKELKASVSATSRRVDNFFHIAKHG